MPIVLFLFLSFLLPSIALSEDLALGLGVNTPSLNLKFKNTADGTGDNRLEWVPNNRSNTAFAFSYGNIGASLSFRQKALTEDKQDIPLDTEFEDYQFRFYGRRHSYSLYYQKYRGYHLQNHNSLDNSIVQTDPLVNNKDLKSEHYGLGYVYNLNPETYSLDSAFGISSSQSKSGGAWLLAGGIDEYVISSPTAFAPSFAEPRVPNLVGLTKVRLTSLSAGGGGAYTFVYNNFYAAGLLMLSLAAQSNELVSTSDSENETQISIKASSGISLGYNSKKYKVFIQTIGETSNVDIGDASVDATMLQIDIMFVYRFGEVHVPVLKQVSQLFD